jgi:hypothetical protein
MSNPLQAMRKKLLAEWFAVIRILKWSWPGSMPSKASGIRKVSPHVVNRQHSIAVNSLCAYNSE